MLKLLKREPFGDIYSQNIDILKYLEKIIKINTKYYSEYDFRPTQRTLREANQGAVYLWLSYLSGVHCLPETDVLLKGTYFHNAYIDYVKEEYRVLSYIIEVEKVKKEKVIGKLYEIDYQKYVEHIKEVSIPTDNIILNHIYIDEKIDGLKQLLKTEKNIREKFCLADIEQYIGNLSKS